MGVTYEKGRNKFRAVYYRDGKAVHVGRFDTRLKATRALNVARKKREEQDELDRTEEKRFEEAFWAIPEDAELDRSMAEEVAEESKPSFVDRIKAIWQNIRQRS